MHEHTDLLYCICEIRTRQGQVLESAGEAPVLRGVGDRRTLGSRELGMSVNRCRRRVTLGHAFPLEKIQRVLALAEEQPVGGARDGDPKEVVQLSEVRHGELEVKTSCDSPEQVRRGSREDDVVDVHQQVGSGASLLKNKEGGVGGRGDEAQLTKVSGETLVPRPQSLLQTI